MRMNDVIEYRKTENILDDISCIVEEAQQIAISSVNVTLVLRNWLVGRRIAEEYMVGSRIERYGEGIISELSDELTEKYGKGFDKRSLYRYVQFYQQYPEIAGVSVPTK